MGEGIKSRTLRAWRTYGFKIFLVVLRYFVFKMRTTKLGTRLGKATVVRFPIDYRYPEHIEVGDNSAIGERAFLVAGSNSKIKMGDYLLLAPNVHINTTMHNYKDLKTPIMLQGGTGKDVIIGNDVWTRYRCNNTPWSKNW